MGRLIPAGTGLPAYKNLKVIVDSDGDEKYPPVNQRHEPTAASMAVNEE